MATGNAGTAPGGAVYPVGLRLLDRRVVVVGGGQVAHRRVAGLLEARAQVTVVSPEVTPALEALRLRPLLGLDLRLGEGTGALLALPLVASAARALRDVATFDSAGVTEKG